MSASVSGNWITVETCWRRTPSTDAVSCLSSRGRLMTWKSHELAFWQDLNTHHPACAPWFLPMIRFCHPAILTILFMTSSRTWRNKGNSPSDTEHENKPGGGRSPSARSGGFWWRWWRRKTPRWSKEIAQKSLTRVMVSQICQAIAVGPLSMALNTLCSGGAVLWLTLHSDHTVARICEGIVN